MRLVLLVLIFVSSFACADVIQITDSRGKLTFDQAPQKVVVINWTLTEQLLELGIKPVAVADIDGYKQQGYKPKIPEGVIDIGKRIAPDFKKIKALKPDIILVGHSQRPLLHFLENLGTVVYFKNFSHRSNNEERSREIFLKLASLFGKSESAKNKLLELDQDLLSLKKRLNTKLKGEMPKVTMLVPEGESVWLFANNSMPFYAASKLGLNLSLEYPASKFGVKKISLKQLPASLGCVLVFDLGQSKHAKAIEELKKKAACFKKLPPVSLYGGAMSILDLSKVIAAGLK